MASELTRRGFVGSLAAAVAAGPLAGQQPKRPNIVLMLADDMGFSDIGCYGGEIDTPNLDRLAGQGVRFTQFYNTARCCPSRSSLLTGLYPHQTGVGHMTDVDQKLPGYRGDLSRQCVTIAEALRPTGYRTLMSGKWHVCRSLTSNKNWPLQRGFDRFFGTITGAGSYFDPVTLTRDNTPIRADAGFYYTDSIADHAVTFINEQARRTEPFFLYTAFTSPHWPLHALAPEMAKYRGRYKEGWDALRVARHRRQIDAGIVDGRWPLTPRDPRVPAWPGAPDKEWQARRMEIFSAQVDRMDQGIGRILAALRQNGMENDTLVMFLADNGGCAEELTATWKGVYIPARTRDGRPVRLGNDPAVMPGPEETYQSYGLPWANASNTPFRLYKHWVHEGGIATPFIARWPGAVRRPNTLTPQVGHLVDVMATCLDAAGAKYPEVHAGNRIRPLVGKSLAPVLRGETRPGHAELFWEHEGNRAVRQGKWKLVSRHPDGWELYDMEADRTEMTDLAQEHPDKVRELTGAYARWARESNVVPWDDLPNHT
jgi:arylsulfatase A-like enzyme